MSTYTIIEKPLWWHQQGLQQTSSGYGAKLISRCCVTIDGETRLRRVYTTIWGNAGTSWFIYHGFKVTIPDSARPGDRWTLNGDPVS